MELTKVDLKKCRTIAFAIVCMAEKDNELEWLVNNSFILDGSYERVALKLFDELTPEIIDAIDGLIERGITAQ